MGGGATNMIFNDAGAIAVGVGGSGGKGAISGRSRRNNVADRHRGAMRTASSRNRLGGGGGAGGRR